MLTRQAPFSQDEIDSINAYQQADWFHPFTCGGDRRDQRHLDGEGVLVASAEGLRCPFCGYFQNWCHAGMADWSWTSLQMRG